MENKLCYENMMFEFNIKIIKKLFYKNNFGIYNFVTNEKKPELSENRDNPGHYVGTLIAITPELITGVAYRIRAKLEYNNKFEQFQYKLVELKENIPTTKEDNENFIRSLFTEKQANEILREYPNIVQDVIAGTDNIDLDKLKGIGEKTWGKLRHKIIETFVMSDIISLLAPVGVTLKMIVKLSEETKDLGLLRKQILENPYILTNIRGLGFKRVDDIAKKVNPDSIRTKSRVMAAIKYMLNDIGNTRGDTWVSLEEAKKQISNLCGEVLDLYDDIIKTILSLPNKTLDGITVIDNDKLCLFTNYKNECIIYNKLKEFNANKIEVEEEDIINGIDLANKDQLFKYDATQIATIRKIVEGSGVQVISGRAGTSKTVISKAILEIYSLAGYNITTMALSAKASLRISEATGFQANTIHKTLGATDLGTFVYNESNKLDADIILIDECSMIDSTLFMSCLTSFKKGCKIILVGDDKQLPAIGCGNVFGDLINQNGKGICEVNVLQKIYRTSKNSGILLDANTIRDNKYPLRKMVSNVVHGDMTYCFKNEDKDMFNSIVKEYLINIETYGIDNVMIIIPRKKNCIISTSHFNITIQNKLLTQQQNINIRGKTFYKGCKIIHRINNYNLGVMNGEIGYIEEIFQDGCRVKFKDKEVFYDIDDMSEIDYGYAITVHSAQGNEFDVVIGAINKSHYTLLDSTLLYTLITRAKKQCTLYSDRFAFSHCIRTSKAVNKNTFLSLINFKY